MIDAATAWTLIAALAVSTIALKSVGPLISGGRRMPARMVAVIASVPPTLLAALVVTATLTDENGDYGASADAVGVLAGAAAVWRTGSVLWAVGVAPVVTAILRVAA